MISFHEGCPLADLDAGAFFVPAAFLAGVVFLGAAALVAEVEGFETGAVDADSAGIVAVG